MQRLVSAALLIYALPAATARCYDPSPVFPLGSLTADIPGLQDAFSAIIPSIKDEISQAQYETSSFSIEVTSSDETLWSLQHTAQKRNQSRPGAPIVTADSVFRIASITKTFTVLGILKQHAAGKLSLDEPIEKYIPELNGSQHGAIPWRDITVRSLASQLSGIPREYALFDLSTSLERPTDFGLPPLPKSDLPPCGGMVGTPKNPCTKKEFLDGIKKMKPLFAPNQESTYSNMAFVLLGIALENVAGVPYTDYIRSAIFEDLEMHHASFETPDDSLAVIPVGENDWDSDLGIGKPTGGMYASSADLSKYLRYVLTHYNGITPALNWLHPVSFSGTGFSFYGMPWEIYRPPSVLSYTDRPITFVTKSGGDPGYVSIIMLVPEYDIGISILTAGNTSLLPRLREVITRPLIRAIDAAVQEDLQNRYAGTYTEASESSTNSSIVLDYNPHLGQFVKTWISNGTDVLSSKLPSLTDWYLAPNWTARLLPTLLYQDEANRDGEIWRIKFVPERPNPGDPAGGLWDDFCINDIDRPTYGGKPVLEVVFFTNYYGFVDRLELTGFRQKLHRERVGKEDLIVQKV